MNAIKSPYDLAIIGAGIGGLALGTILSARGKRVLILEKNSWVGGRVTSYERDGFQIDLGAHVISRSDKGPLGEILRLAGKENRVTFQYVRPLTSFQGKIFAFPRGLEELIPGRDFQDLMRMLQTMTSMTDAETHEFDLEDLRSYIQRFTRNPLSVSCLNNICMVYVCLPYFEASAGEFIRCLKWEAGARASGYPEGGCRSISEALADFIREKGGKILTTAPAAKILVRDNAVRGLESPGAFFPARTIISNADPYHTVIELTGREFFPDDYLEKVQSLTYSYSMLNLRLALKEPVASWKLLTHIGSDNPELYEENTRADLVPDDVSIFCPVPSNFAPAVAPPGRQLLTAGAIIPYSTSRIEEWQEAILKTLDRLIPGYRDKLLWVEKTTPADINQAVGESGAIIGAGQSTGQVGKNRLPSETPVQGLYLCGSEAGGSGVGIELAIRSAQDLAEKICR